jgi:hypothetical protein
MQMSTRHFYIYNECYKPITATVEYVPIGEESPNKNDVLVQPGNQGMLCTTEQSTVVTESKAEDGSLHWNKLTVSLSGDEYTHVIACRCMEGDVDCELPQSWPLPTTRQYPVEQEEA